MQRILVLPLEKPRISTRGGNMFRFFSGPLLAGLLTLTLSTATSRADDKCTIATKDKNAVVDACKEGGIKKAKSVMKAMQKKGKEKGLKFECDTCHKDEAAGNWTLNKDAEAKFKELLKAQ
jgi:hypothetical protein